MKARNFPDGTPPRVFAGVHTVRVCSDLLRGGAVEVAALVPHTSQFRPCRRAGPHTVQLSNCSGLFFFLQLFFLADVNDSVGPGPPSRWFGRVSLLTCQNRPVFLLNKFNVHLLPNFDFCIKSQPRFIL